MKRREGRTKDDERERAKLKHGIGSCITLPPSLDPCVSRCESTGSSTSQAARLREVQATSPRNIRPSSEGEIGGIVALERRKQRSSRRSVGRSVGPIVSEKGGSSMQWASHGRPRPRSAGRPEATFTGLLRRQGSSAARDPLRLFLLLITELDCSV